MSLIQRMKKNNPNPKSDEKLLSWYVIYTKPRQEFIAFDNLKNQGFRVYLPRYKKFKKASKNAASNSPTLVREAMFPRYLFLQTKSPEQSLSKVNHTRGVSGIIRFGPKLATIPQALIDEVQAVEKTREDASIDDIKQLKPGTHVRLNEHSPFEHLEGLVESSSSKRVTVLLKTLGSLQKVTTHAAHVDIVK